MSTGCAGASESANEDGRRSHHPTLQNPSEQGTQLEEATVPEAFAFKPVHTPQDGFCSYKPYSFSNLSESTFPSAFSFVLSMRW